MKKSFKIIGSTLVMCFTFIACEMNEPDLVPEMDEIKKANLGMIKSYDNAMVLTWNEALGKVIDNKMPPASEARNYVMVSIAVHDALNNVVPIFETYAMDNSLVEYMDISKKNIKSIADAAVAQAAHDIMVVVAPGSAPGAALLLETSLNSIEDSDFKTRGIEVGKQAALSLLTERQNDPPLRFQTYEQGTLPGEYRSTMPYAAENLPTWPANSAYAPDMGSFRPFGIETGDQFRAIPPYPLDSPEYAADFNEVKEYGSNTSTVRSQEKTDLGVFFIDNISNVMNRVARTMSVSESLDGWETARLLALTHMVQFDAHLSSFEGKYHYNRWRPITAIRLGAIDENDDTTEDPAWIILQAARATPPTPTYPSTHSEMGGAGAELFRLFFKKDDLSFTTQSYNLPGVERQYSSFSKLAADIAVSRIYIGYHFRNDVMQGEKMGKELAKYVFANNLKRL